MMVLKRVQWSYAWSKRRLAPTQSATVSDDGESDLERRLGDVARADVVEQEGGERDEHEQPEHAA